MFSSKIEDLQAQIYVLEKQNKEYYDQLVKQDKGKNKIMKAKRNSIVLMKRCSQSPKKVSKLWKKPSFWLIKVVAFGPLETLYSLVGENEAKF